MFEHHKEFQVSKEYPKANYSLHPNKYAMGLRHKCRQQKKNTDALSIKILFLTFGSSLLLLSLSTKLNDYSLLIIMSNNAYLDNKTHNIQSIN